MSLEKFYNYEFNRFLSFRFCRNPMFVKKMAHLSAIGLYYYWPPYSSYGYIKCAFCSFVEYLHINSNAYYISFNHFHQSKNRNCFNKENIFINEFQYKFFQNINLFDAYILISMVQNSQNSFLYYDFPVHFENKLPIEAIGNKCPYCYFDKNLYSAHFFPHDLDWIHAIHSNSLDGCQWLNRKYGKQFCFRVKLWQSGFLINKTTNHLLFFNPTYLINTLNKYYTSFLNIFSKLELYKIAYRIYNIRQELTSKNRLEKKNLEPVCAICLINFIDCVLLDCGHLFCKKCIHLIDSKKCSICRSDIKEIKTVYL